MSPCRNCIENERAEKRGIVMPTELPTEIQIWPIDKLVFYARNPRKNDSAVDRMCGSIREFGFKIPCLIRSDGEVIDGQYYNAANLKCSVKAIWRGPSAPSN